MLCLDFSYIDHFQVTSKWSKKDLQSFTIITALKTEFSTHYKKNSHNKTDKQ